MGKGDRKSRKGKIILGSYGKKRLRRASKAYPATTEKSKD